MKQVFLGMGLVLALAACGGGGSTGGPNPLPSTQPKTVYTAHIVFTGPLAGRTMQDDLRRMQSLSPMAAGATPIPVMLVSPSGRTCLAQTCTNDPSNSLGGQIKVEVSPAPSSSPVVTFSDAAAPHVLLQATPTPGASPAPQATGVVGVTNVIGDGTPEVQAAGTIIANVGSPVNTQPSTQVYQYYRAAVACNIYADGDAQGWTFDGSKWVAATDISTADLYVTGSQCAGVYNVPGDSGTLHYPGGGTFISNDTAFVDVQVSQFANNGTSELLNTIGSPNPDGSTNSELVAQTRDGKYRFKVFALGTSHTCTGECGFVGAIETAGGGVDGFGP